MSTIFGDPKSLPGCFYKQTMNGGKEGAAFSMFSSQYAIVQSFNFNRADDYAPVKCLGDVAYLNSFGRASTANIHVVLTLFLIDGGSYSGVLEDAKESFTQHRLAGASAGGSEDCSLTVGSRTLATGYPVGFGVSASSDRVGLGSAEIQMVSLNHR